MAICTLSCILFHWKEQQKNKNKYVNKIKIILFDYIEVTKYKEWHVTILLFKYL